MMNSKKNYFHEKKEEWFSEYHTKQVSLRDPSRQVRIHKRRCSDGFVGVNMPSVFADRIKPEGENLERYV